MVVALLIVPLRFMVQWLRKATQRLKSKNNYCSLSKGLGSVYSSLLFFGVKYLRHSSISFLARSAHKWAARLLLACPNKYTFAHGDESRVLP